MKSSWKMKAVTAISAVAFLFCGCQASLTCLSHIDRDSNGKCDNCGTKMEIVIKNVETLTIKTLPEKTYYKLNETIDVTGGVLSVVYNDGTPAADIPFTHEEVKIKAPGTGTAGKKSVGVTYHNKTVRYDIDVGSARFTVSFDACYENAPVIESKYVTINGYATAPEAKREGYDLVGWYTDDKFTSEFVFESTPITKDITLFANWAKQYNVTYDLCFGENKVEKKTVKGKVENFKPEDRSGFRFIGWFYDTATSQPVDFDATVEENLTVYAKWLSDSADIAKVTFNMNYGATPQTIETDIPAGSTVAKPATPKRANVTTKGHQAQDFKFADWYTDKECKSKFDFNSAVEEDITLYAKWTGTYIFEAEHVNLVDDDGMPLQGMGASGGSQGREMVDPPAPGCEGMNASNGFYVTYLYAEGLQIKFNIVSDRDVSDATLVFRITCENVGFAIDPAMNDGETFNGTILSRYEIALNDTAIQYETIEITDASGHPDSGGRRPFSDHTLAVNLSLKKGNNTFTFLTANGHGMGGTMSGTAPVIDCIKVTTSANLTWEPMIDNEYGQ